MRFIMSSAADAMHITRTIVEQASSNSHDCRSRGNSRQTRISLNLPVRGYLYTNPVLIFVGYYLATSCIAFLAIGFDKRAAMTGRRRTSERKLHLLSAAGGWPGTWLACRAFRHKTQKLSFRRGLGVTIALNVALAAGLLVAGRAYLS